MMVASMICMHERNFLCFDADYLFKYFICCSFEQVAVNFDSWVSCHVLVLQCWKQAEVSIVGLCCIRKVLGIYELLLHEKPIRCVNDVNLNGVKCKMSTGSILGRKQCSRWQEKPQWWASTRCRTNPMDTHPDNLDWWSHCLGVTSCVCCWCFTALFSKCHCCNSKFEISLYNLGNRSGTFS